MTRKTLLLGAGGMLGRAWSRELERRAALFTALDRTGLDFGNLDAISALDLEGYQVVVNCVAHTDVDGAESDEALATRINGEAVGALAARCKKAGAVLVHYSTDYVFPGEAERPYPVDHPREPLNAYGRSKLVGELALEASGSAYLLIRTSWLYAAWGKNFVRTIATAADQRPELRVVDDQRGRPTSVVHLADVSARLLEQDGVGGTFHVSDGGECTWFDFATEIVRQRGAKARVVPCTSAEFPRPAKRPAYSVLDLSRAESLVGAFPDWRDNLAAVLREL